MEMPPKIFETSRLILRPPVLEDAASIFYGYAQDPEVTKYLTWRPHPNLDTTTEFLQRCVRCWQEGTAFPWAALLQNSRELIGMIELRIDSFQADLGYGLVRRYWGNGYAPEMTRAIVQWAITQKEIYRVWAICDIENLASARVLEKVGMQPEGILRRFILHPNISSEPRDCYCYSMVK